jgi:hypothetical protein
MNPRERGEAWTGDGYGTMRYDLFCHARKRIEEALQHGYHCEAIAICESVIVFQKNNFTAVLFTQVRPQPGVSSW